MEFLSDYWPKALVHVIGNTSFPGDFVFLSSLMAQFCSAMEKADIMKLLAVMSCYYWLSWCVATGCHDI